MKLYGPGGTPIPRSAIIPHLYMASAESAPADHPSESISVPSGYRILSGGAFDDYGSGQGNLLVEDDWDTANNTTIASGKDHIVADVCPIFDYALAIDNNPISGFGLLKDTTLEVSVPVTTHLQSTGIGFPGGGWAPCGIGAKSTYTGAGRLLYEMYYQDASGVTFSSKDQVDSDISGTLSGIITFVKPAQ
jgi:hypothetical protein